MATTTRSTRTKTAPAKDQTREQLAASLRAANTAQARKASVRNGQAPDTATKTGNPATTTNPATGKRQGPPRKPLPAAKAPAKATPKPTGTKATKPTAKKPTAKKPAPKPTPAPKADTAGMVRKSLAARLIQAAADEFADDNEADQQKVANWLKIVTSGVDVLPGVEDADEWGVVGADGGGCENPAGRCCGGVFVGEVPVVVGKVLVVSVDDLGDRGAGGWFVDEVLAGGEGGDQGLQGEVVDRPGVAAGGGVDQVQCVLGE